MCNSPVYGLFNQYSDLTLVTAVKTAGVCYSKRAAFYAAAGLLERINGVTPFAYLPVAYDHLWLVGFLVLTGNGGA